MEKIPSISSEINKVEVDKFIFNNFNSISPYFYKLISEWMSDAYKIFKDLDKFLILIYLINTDFEFFRRNNLNITYESFYKDKTLEINKINLIQISKDLNIPKESVRRKVSNLEKNGIIKKKGKKITIDRSAYKSTQPIDTLRNISALLSVFSKILKKEKVIKNDMDSNEISNLIKNNFSFCWYQFYKFLFPYCLRWKTYFGDLELFTILQTIISNSNSRINKKIKDVDSYLENWRDNLVNQKIKGINAMSISEITNIPRPTVVRKIKKLTKNKFISLDKQKLINIDVNKENFNSMSKIQDENIKSVNIFIKRTFNQINLN